MAQHTSKLANATAGKSPSSPAVSRLQSASARARVAVPYVIPGLDLGCLITIPGSERLLDLEAQADQKMAARGVEQRYDNEDKFELQRACIVLSEAIRDDESEKPVKSANPPPLAPREDWAALSPEIVAAVWYRFCEVRMQYDPMADDVRVTTEEMVAIRDAIKKKDTRALRFFGLQRLIVYMLIGESQQSTSPTHRSESGPTSQDSSSGGTSVSTGSDS